METIKVKTKEGELRGEKAGEIMIFRGIPYAEAPVGSMRFAAPASRKAWMGVKDALSFGSMCPQKDPREGFSGKEFYDGLDSEKLKMDEDCLHLNVWAPIDGENHPVAVWFHGGSFERGASFEKEMDGTAFARAGIVFVSVNYRVGVFGFMADPFLAKENPHGSTGNYGLMDQIEALKWVHRNIVAFHGNPERVTVMGQSAGAMSVQALITSPLTTGLISQAVMQSGGGFFHGHGPTYFQDQAYEVGRKVLELCHVKTVDQLRLLPAENLVAILPALHEEFGELPFRPMVDGYVLKETMDEACEKGDVPDIPYMLGLTGNDILVMPGQSGRNSMFANGCRDFADVCKDHWNHVYLYYFDRKLPGDEAGAFHGSELWYVFRTLDRSWRPMTAHDYQLSRNMSEAWQQFIIDGGPGWKAYTRESDFIRTWM